MPPSALPEDYTWETFEDTVRVPVPPGWSFRESLLCPDESTVPESHTSGCGRRILHYTGVMLNFIPDTQETYRKPPQRVAEISFDPFVYSYATRGPLKRVEQDHATYLTQEVTTSHKYSVLTAHCLPAAKNHKASLTVEGEPWLVFATGSTVNLDPKQPEVYQTCTLIVDNLLPIVSVE